MNLSFSPKNEKKIMTTSNVLGRFARRKYPGNNAIQEIVFCCLVTLVVVDSHVIRSEGSTSHLPRGLNSPCGPSISGDTPVFTIGTLQRNVVLSKLEEVRTITNQLVIGTQGMLPMPEIYSQEIIGLPGQEDISTYRNLTVDYTVVSHLLVFVDIAYTDQGSPHQIVHQRQLWGELRRQILSLLCDMYRRMANTPYIVSEITPTCVRDASCGGQRSIFSRDRRNFVIASAALEVFNRLHQTYSLLPAQ